eukprot:3598237-Rhodomonas_salina.1
MRLQLDFGSQGVGLQLRFSAAHEPPNSVVRLSFNDQNLHEMFIEVRSLCSQSVLPVGFGAADAARLMTIEDDGG